MTMVVGSREPAGEKHVGFDSAPRAIIIAFTPAKHHQLSNARQVTKRRTCDFTDPLLVRYAITIPIRNDGNSRFRYRFDDLLESIQQRWLGGSHRLCTTVYRDG